MHAVTDCLFAGAGLMLGLVHFLGLRIGTRLFLEQVRLLFRGGENRDALEAFHGVNLRVIGLHLLRVAATGVAFSLIALAGALPLLAALVGFLFARTAVQRVAGSP